MYNRSFSEKTLYRRKKNLRYIVLLIQLIFITVYVVVFFIIYIINNVRMCVPYFCCTSNNANNSWQICKRDCCQ